MNFTQDECDEINALVARILKVIPDDANAFDVLCAAAALVAIVATQQDADNKRVIEFFGRALRHAVKNGRWVPVH